MTELAPKRRWFQFGLRAMLLAVTVLGVALGVVVQRAQRQRRAVDTIERLGGTVWYDFHYHDESYGTVRDMADQPPTDWKWARRWLDKHYFDTVWGVEAIKKEYWQDEPGSRIITNFGPALIETEFTQTPSLAMDQLARLRRLRSLDLSNSQTTDADLEHIRGLTELEELHLEKTLVTDAGMQIVSELKRLKNLRLYGTAVTDECIEELQRTLPDCSIGWLRKK